MIFFISLTKYIRFYSTIIVCLLNDELVIILSRLWINYLIIFMLYTDLLACSLVEIQFYLSKR